MKSISFKVTFFLYCIGTIFGQYVPLYSSSFQMIQRASTSSPLQIDINKQVLDDFLILGYFKLQSTPNKSSLIRVSVEPEYYNILHLFADLPASIIYSKAIVDIQNYFQVIQVASNSPIGQWKIYGIGYKSLSQQLYLVHGYNTLNMLQLNSTSILYPLFERITPITVCIGCQMMGSVFSPLSGEFSTVKLLTGFTITGQNTFYYLLEDMNLNQLKSLYQSNEALIVFINSKFPLANVICSLGYGFFDGVCVLQNNCLSILQPKIDEFGIINNSIFQDLLSFSCGFCDDNCSTCTISSLCSKCDFGFVLDQLTLQCKRCSSNTFFDSTTESCVNFCPSGFQKDLSNGICVESFGIHLHTIGPFFNKRQFNSNDRFQMLLTSTNVIITSIYEQCLFDKNSIRLHTFYGGSNLLASNSIQTNIFSIPTNTLKRTISFYAFSTGNFVDLVLEVNLITIPIKTNTTINTGIGLCLNPAINYTISHLTYELFDTNSNYIIKIFSTADGWGIKNFQVESTKCFPTCSSCYGIAADQCWSCTKKQQEQFHQCFCDPGYYVQHNPSCYQTACYFCTQCPPECATCEDITGKCTSCQNGYLLLNNSCIIQSDCNGYYSASSKHCVQTEFVIFKHFFDNKIEQYYDYWLLAEQGGIRNYDCLGQTWVGLGWTNYIQLKNQFDQYFSYNHSFKLLLSSSNKDSLEGGDDMYVTESSGMNQLIYGAYNEAGSSIGCGNPLFNELLKKHQYIQPKSSNQFNLEMKVYLDEDFNNEAHLVKDVQLSFCTCHPSCNQCSSNYPYVCTSCIPNASLQNSQPECLCNSNFYLSINSINQRGECLQCNKACLTCTGPQILDCITCNYGYIMESSKCVQVCPIGMYWDNTHSKCLECSSCCQECNGPLDTDCFSCSSQTELTYSQGKCYFVLDGSQCKSCSQFVNQTCGGTNQTNVNYCNYLEWFQVSLTACGQCKKQFEICGGPTYNSFCEDAGYLYSTGLALCYPCSLATQNKCGIQSIQQSCTNAGWKFYQSSTCIKCDQNSIDPLCNVCHSSCQTCSGPSETQCLSCFNGFYSFQGHCLSACPNGYQLNLSTQSCQECQFLSTSGCQSCFPTCQICSPFQISANSNTCTACYPSRILSQTGQCNCLDPEDIRENYYECSYQSQAVLDILLSNNSPIMTIEFGKVLQDLSSYPGGNQHEICEAIFEQNSLDLLGTDSLCSIEGSKILVTLGQNSEILEGDILALLPNVLMFQSEQNSIMTFLNNKVIQQRPLSVQIAFYYNKQADSCKDFEITLRSLEGDCQRGFKSNQWSLLNKNLADPVDVAIVQILEQASQNKLSTLIIPQGTIPVEVEKTIQLISVLKNTFTNTKEFTFHFSKKSISSTITKAIASPYFRFNQADISLAWELKYCDEHGTPTYFQDDVNFTISSPQTQSLAVLKTNYSQSSYIKTILPYSLNSSSFYQLDVSIHYLYQYQQPFHQIKVYLSSDNSIFTENFVQLNIDTSPLIVQIKGGSKQLDYRKSKTFDSFAQDRDLEDPLANQQIALQWVCIDPVSQSQCISVDGKLVAFSSGPTATFDAGTFSPYTFVILQLKGTKDSRTSSTQCNVIFSEFDLPDLSMIFKIIDLKQETINLNEEIYIEIDYGQQINTDILSYSGAIVYELLPVGAIKYDYLTFRFKLWDIFSNFVRSSPFFSLRFSVFNPNNFMPSSQIIQFKLNFPPDQCNFLVTSNEATKTAVSTIFFLEMKGCIDEDVPIMYQFFIYANQADLDEEIQNPKIIRRMQITDMSFDSKTTTVLPAGDVILMGMAIDKKQAISNITQVISVYELNVDETTFSGLINQYLDSNNKTLATYISSLDILSYDLSQRTTFQSSQINQQKKDIISSLQNSTLQLPLASTFGSAADKAINKIISSGIQYSQSEIESQLLLMSQVLNSDLPQTFTELKKEQRKEQLFDYYSILDDVQSISNCGDSQNTSTLLLNLTNKIADTINEYSLPNEDRIIFQGTNIKMSTQKITSKHVCAYYMCDSTDFLAQSSSSTNSTTIYDISFNQYQKNPFFHDDSLSNYTTYLKKYATQPLTTYPFVIPKVTYANNSLAIIEKDINIEFKKNNLKTEGLTCLKKSSLGWSKQGCKNIYKAKYQSFTCVCDEVSPTTIIDDLDSLIKNPNVLNASSPQGITNTETYRDFYQYFVFWAILIETIIFLILFVKAKGLDKIDRKFFLMRSSIKVFPLQQQQSSDENITKFRTTQYQQQSSLDENTSKFRTTQYQEPNQISGLNKQLTEEFKDLEFESSQRNRVPSLYRNHRKNKKMKVSQYDSVSQKGNGMSPRFLEKKSTFQQQQLDEIITNISTTPGKNREFNFFQEDEVIHDPQLSPTPFENKQKTQESIPDQKEEEFVIKRENYLSFVELNWAKQILFFHNLYNIFLIYDPKVSRRLRISMLYVRLVHSLSIAIICDQKYNQLEIIIISIINGGIVTIALRLLEILIRQSWIGKLISCIFQAGLVIFYYCVIISIFIWEQKAKSNRSRDPFIIILFSDIIVIATLTAIIFKYLARFVLQRQGKINFSSHIISILKLELIIKIISK